MSFNAKLTIPVSTLITNPASVDLTLQEGTIIETRIKIPDGPAGLVGVWVEYLSRQILPFNNTEQFISDNETILLTEKIIIDTAPYKLTIKGYNQDDTFPHTIYFSFSMDFPNSNRGIVGSIIDKIVGLSG